MAYRKRRVAASIKNSIKGRDARKKRREDSSLKEKEEHNESHNHERDSEMPPIQKPELDGSFRDFDNDVVMSDEQFKQYEGNIEIISSDENDYTSMEVGQSMNSESQSRDKSEASEASRGRTDKVLRQRSKSGYSLEEIEELLEQKQSEIVFFSEKMELLQETCSKMKTLEEENIKIRRSIFTVQTARDEYRSKLTRMGRTIGSISKKLRYHTLSANRGTIVNTKEVEKYSDLKNATSKKNRKRAAVSALQNIAKEENIQELLNDVIEMMDRDPEQTFRYKLSVWESVIVKSKANLSFGQLEIIKKLVVQFTGKDFLPSVKLTRELANSECNINMFQGSLRIARENCIH